MKKSLLKIIFVIMILLFPIVSKAAIKCSDITNEIDNYNTIVDKLENLDCDNVEDGQIVKECNELQTKKALSLSTLFSYNDEDTKCSKKKLTPIIEENKDECTNVFGTTLIDISKTAYKAFYIIAPFLLMIFGMLDFSKIVTAGDPLFSPKDASGNSMPSVIKKARSNFIKRLISFILIFFIPLIVDLLLQLNITGLDYNSNIYSCKSKISFQQERWKTTYIPQTQSKSKGLSSGGASSLVEAAGKVHEQQKDYYYSVGGDLFWNDIEKSLNNPNKVTCCATFVGTALYVAGIFTEDEMNSYNYNSAPDTSDFLASKGWIRISNYSDLQAGDVVFMTSGGDPGIGHTQLYAGDGTWYNAGGNCAIRDAAGEIDGCGISSSPYADDASGRFLHAYRQP